MQVKMSRLYEAKLSSTPEVQSSPVMSLLSTAEEPQPSSSAETTSQEGSFLVHLDLHEKSDSYSGSSENKSLLLFT